VFCDEQMSGMMDGDGEEEEEEGSGFDYASDVT
jgi:hypothetical protein